MCINIKSNLPKVSAKACYIPAEHARLHIIMLQGSIERGTYSLGDSFMARRNSCTNNRDLL